MSLSETNLNDIATAGAELQYFCHKAASDAGWWGTPDGRIPGPRSNSLCFSNKLCLIHSEVPEAMEGDRKNLPDDKLPHREMREVELADVAIRVFECHSGREAAARRCGLSELCDEFGGLRAAINKKEVVPCPQSHKPQSKPSSAYLTPSSGCTTPCC